MSAPYPDGLEPRSFYAGDVHEGTPGYGVTVEWRGEGQWAVCFKGLCATRTGRLSYERNPSSRTPHWVKTHRFTLEEAALIAQKVLKAERKNVQKLIAFREKRAGGSPQEGRSGR